MDKYCSSCNLVLPPTAQRCTTCGKIATLAPNNAVNSGADIYTIVSVLGIGGMGIVYKATDSLGIYVVVKQLYVDNPADLADAQRRFKREAQVQAGLNSPYYPAGFGYFQDQGLEFMAMEFVPGDDLEKTLAARGGKMSEDEVLQLGIQICDGLSVLHNYVDPTTNTPQPLVHRDVKPANIILRPWGQIIILDLGIARTVKQTAGTQARATRAGTLEYASLQMVTGTDMSIRDDIYSLAATLFHLIIGHPFVGDFTQRASEIDALPPNWRASFRRAIHNDTNLRQRSMDEFKADLVNLLPLQLRPAVAGATVPPPGPVANPAVNVGIRWQVFRSVMVNANEYRQNIGGQVLTGTTPVPGARVVPLMNDIGAGAMAVNTYGTAVHTGLHGDFGLTVPDVTVPVTVDERQIQVIVEDATTGAELYRELAIIHRPNVARRARARGAAGVGAAAHVAVAPFRAAGHGAAAVGRGIGAGARGLGRGIAWPFRQVAAMGAALTGVGTISAISGLLMLVTWILVWLASKQLPMVGYLWLHSFLGSLAAALVAFRMRQRYKLNGTPKPQRTLGQALRSPLLVAFATLWTAATIGWLFGPK